MKNIKLLHGDCLELMKDIPDKSIDMILTDPPYGTTASKWDSVIPFEMLWEQYERTIKDNGAIVLFSSGRFTQRLIQSNEDLYRYKWVWVKTRVGNFVNAKNRPLTNYEEICVFSKGITANTKHTERKMQYYPQELIEVNKKVNAGESKFGTMHGKQPSHQPSYTVNYTNYPTDVLEFASVGKPLHPTQKPVSLLEYLVKTYTNEGETVLDNCMGSGSTGVACLNTNRKFIGMELDAEYFEIAKQRISEAQRGGKA